MPEALPTHCLACGGSAFRLVEAVPVRRLARAYAEDRAGHVLVNGRAGRGAGADTATAPRGESGWLAAISKALEVEEIRFHGCLVCGLEMASPRRCWAEGAYPEDEHYPLRWEFGRFLDDLGPPAKNLLELG